MSKQKNFSFAKRMTKLKEEQRKLYRAKIAALNKLKGKVVRIVFQEANENPRQIIGLLGNSWIERPFKDFDIEDVIALKAPVTGKIFTSISVRYILSIKVNN